MNIVSLVGLRHIRFAFLLVALGLSSCSTPQGEADGRPFDLAQESARDAELTTRIKAALVADERVLAASIQVVLVNQAELSRGEAPREAGESEAHDESESVGEANGEFIRLEGFVGDEAERAAALGVARAASDGLEIIDALEIR